MGFKAEQSEVNHEIIHEQFGMCLFWRLFPKWWLLGSMFLFSPPFLVVVGRVVEIQIHLAAGNCFLFAPFQRQPSVEGPFC